ncbi:hypothetical protein PC123_g28023 [Phytophthora cactorum]|nr:hypothetical protein PC123_g28023 [Phytophthora cactorum]
MLHHAKLDKRFWAEAAMTAIYVKNRLPSPKIEHKTPFEIVYKSKPSVKHMRVFGCRTYILTPKEKRLKWDPKARTGLFLGYEEVSKAYRLLLRVTGLVSVIDREPVSPNRSNPNPRRLRYRGLRHCRLRHLWVQDCRYKIVGTRWASTWRSLIG